jgi:predicted ester cyclase
MARSLLSEINNTACGSIGTLLDVSLAGNKKIAADSFLVIERGDAALAQRIIHPDFVNREADDDPHDSARQERGPHGFMATANWLRAAFSNLHFELQEIVAEGGHVVVSAVMIGTHAGEFQRIAPTGRPIRQRQMHLFCLRDGLLIEHTAQRDDLGLLLSLGWRPGPTYTP